MWNGLPFKFLGGTKIHIREKKYDMTPCMQNDLVKSSNDTAKFFSDTANVVFRDFLNTTGYYNHDHMKCRLSNRDRYLENHLDDEIGTFLSLDTKLEGKGVEKN